MRVSVALSKASQSESIPKNFALDDPNSLFGKEGVNSVQVNDSLIAGKSFLIFRFGRTGGKMFYLAVDQANIGPANIEKFFSVLAVEENHATGDINASENRFAGECYVYRFDDTSSLDTAFEQLKGLPKMETFEGSVQ